MDNTASVLICDPNIENGKLKIHYRQEEESWVQKSAPLLPSRIAIVLGLLNIATGENENCIYIQSEGEIWSQALVLCLQHKLYSVESLAHLNLIWRVISSVLWQPLSSSVLHQFSLDGFGASCKYIVTVSFFPFLIYIFFQPWCVLDQKE